MNRGDLIYNYPLYSLKRLPTFIKYGRQVAKKIGGRKWLAVLLDMLWCNIRYGAMDSRDYMIFEFYKKNARERKKYFTKRKYFKLIRKFDKSKFLYLLEKENQYREYSKFIHRNWLFINKNVSWENLLDFVGKYQEVILKPVSSDCGKGIFKFSKGNRYGELREIFDNWGNVEYIAEEVMHNCPDLDGLNPHSLNTVRVTYVLRKDSVPLIFSVMLRTGAVKGNVTDNWGAGGILMNVDIETGLVSQPGLDEKCNPYLYHPITGMKLVGFEIPRYREIIEFAKDVAFHNHDVVYGGLDIAVTADGLELIEVNFPPAYIGYQAFGEGALNYLKKIGK